MKFRRALQIFGMLLLVAFGALVVYWLAGRSGAARREAAIRGEEVYASHDCTDCHLPAHVLKQKRQKNELGLLRVRTNSDVFVRFLETDERHKTFVMISPADRSDLIEYLRGLVVR